ncbi:MAG: NADH-quinone oxidoreductase subunit N [Phycisphaerae bacterium]|nr:NADH-quinone oxidoreductase subunit N [Phycisphaerae bacterium]
MLPKIVLILPEILLVVGAVIVTVLGLSRRKVVRDAVPAVTLALLVGALAVTHYVTNDSRLAAADLLMPGLAVYGKSLILIVAMGLVLLSVGLVDRKLEAAFSTGRASFDAIRVIRGEYHAFFLLSIAGACLLCTAPDLIWLFLAIELVSLPSYIMVAISRSSRKAQEAAVKYFFLGALSSAILLYGFALLYGATGTLELVAMRDILTQQAAAGGVSTIAIIGLVLTIIGLCYKISAVPMHFYAPDVYEGASTPVTAFLAFVPKAAGFIALILILECVGWSGHKFVRGGETYEIARGLPQPITALLWMVAVLTMTLGNVGALLQRNVKRMLAYSSVAHSGYMIIGLIAGPVGVMGVSGVNATLFYLLAYALMNIATFGPLASLERNGEGIETLDDIAGLRQRHPWMAAMLAIGAASLIGLPPLLGFWGKFYLLMAGIEAGQTTLVVIAAINSGIAAWYYLRLMTEPLVGAPNARSETITAGPSIWPRVATVVMALALIVLPIGLGRVVAAANAVTRGLDRGVAKVPAAAPTEIAPIAVGMSAGTRP